jgi:hypothetical protein
VRRAIGEAFTDHSCALEDIALAAPDLTRDELVAIVFTDAAEMREVEQRTRAAIERRTGRRSPRLDEA